MHFTSIQKSNMKKEEKIGLFDEGENVKRRLKVKIPTRALETDKLHTNLLK